MQSSGTGEEDVQRAYSRGQKGAVKQELVEPPGFLEAGWRGDRRAGTAWGSRMRWWRRGLRQGRLLLFPRRVGHYSEADRQVQRAKQGQVPGFAPVDKPRNARILRQIENRVP